MKYFTRFTLLFAIPLLAFSCKKEKNTIIPKPIPGVLLEIKQGNYSYVAKNGNHFYSSSFMSKNDTDLYRIKVNKGVKYHLFCLQDGQYNYYNELVLMNSIFDTLSLGSSYYGSEIFFTSNYTEELFLTVRLKSYYNETLNYRLYFETDFMTAYDFFNLSWEGIGPWKKINDQKIEFSGSDAMQYRWLKLLSPIPDDKDISFTIKSPATANFPSIGFVVGSSPDLFAGGNFESGNGQYGALFQITSTTGYYLNQFNGSGYSGYSGNFNAIININNGVSIKILYNNYSGYRSIYINNSFVTNITALKVNEFYLVINDRIIEEISFENLIFD